MKVAYNVFSDADQQSPFQAFLWRIIAGIYGVVNPNFTAAHVPSFLAGVRCSGRIEEINFEQVVAFAMKTLPNNQPWILAVDELIKLPVAKHVIGSILSTCTKWVQLSEESSNIWRCVVMTSFVPGLFNFLTLSNRAPIYIAPSLLRAESCGAMAREFGHDPANPLVMSANSHGCGPSPRTVSGLGVFAKT